LIAKVVFVTNWLMSFTFKHLLEEQFFLIEFHLEELRSQAWILKIHFLLVLHFDEEFFLFIE
jgi:hypothetical protein